MEYFYGIPSGAKYDKNTNAITQHRFSGCTFYGSTVIKSTKPACYTWTFKIICRNILSEANGICIGIDEHHCKWKEDYFYQKKGSNYAYYADSGCSDGYKYHSGEYKKYGSRITHNDTVTMILDLSPSNSALYFLKNGKNQGIAYKNIKRHKNIKYRMAVSTYMKRQSVRLLSYSCIPINDNSNDNIQTNIQNVNTFDNAVDDQKEIIKRLTNEYDKLRLSFSLKIKQITNKLDNVQKKNVSLNKNIDDLNQQQSQLKSQNTQLIEKNQLVTAQNSKYHSDNIELQVTNNFNDLQKEKDKLNVELQLLRLNNLDESKYLNWNTEQVIHWIINLDYNKFNLYKQILIKSLNEESVDGECFDIITESDIKLWGIKNMKHRKFIYEKIQNIVKKNNINNNMNDNNHNNYNQHNDEGPAPVPAQTAYI